MYYLCCRDIYSSTAYHISVHGITYETLCHTNPVISTAEEMGEYRQPKKGMELEINLSLTLSSIHPEISLVTYKIFLPGK